MQRCGQEFYIKLRFVSVITLTISMSDICFLCKTQINNALKSSYSVSALFTKYTNQLLRQYLLCTFQNKVVINANSLICNRCKLIVDNLDYAENAFKMLREIVWNFLGHTNDLQCNVYCKTDVSKIIPLNCEQNLQNSQTNLILENKKNTFDVKKAAIKEENLNPEDLKSSNLNTYMNSTGKASIIINEKLKANCSVALKPYQCSVCPKKWKTLTDLKNHQASHSSDRPFICEICGQSYKQKTALDIHIGMHNGIYPFVCNYCKKTFTQKGALQRHIPIHTGNAPYQCDMCGKCFIHHTSFNIHKLSHTGQKDYKCSECGLALLSASHLKRHMRVHTGEKKYLCNICEKRFAERYNLISHQKLHKRVTDSAHIRNYRCPLCTETFCGRLKLDEHLVQTHQKI